MRYLIRPPFPYRWLYPRAMFRGDTQREAVHLTFDDGPHPEATPFVLDTLAGAGVKATFFLLGKNAENHPQLVERIRQEGHSIGNHGHAHLDGWRTPTQAYLDDFSRGMEVTGSRLFRPAYGRITPMQYRAISRQSTVVLWDVLSGDFDQDTDPGQCVRNVERHTRKGSIIVMHDSQKALHNLRGSLKAIILSMNSAGFRMEKL